MIRGKKVVHIMSKVKLFDHQIEALNATERYNRVLFALDMG
jgi:hypothetical protein